MFVRVLAVSANECTCVSTCAVDGTFISCVTSDRTCLTLRDRYISRGNKNNYLQLAIERGLNAFITICIFLILFQTRIHLTTERLLID